MPACLHAELDDFVAAYEKAQLADPVTTLRIESFLPPPGHPLRQAVLCELIRVEMELLWHAGQPRSLQDYLADYPALGGDLVGLGEIAYEEYRLRLLAGQHPTPEEYALRHGIDTTRWFVPSASSRPDSLTQTRPAGDGDSSSKSGYPAPGDRIVGFRIGKELGRGSFARVYLAEEENLSARPVALKLAPASLVGEAHLLARLQHTHIVPIYSLHQAGDKVAICMPFLGGLTLRDLIQQLRVEPCLPRSGAWLADRLGPDPAGASPARATLRSVTHVEAALWITARLAEALAHAHERGVLHRDLKPANVLIAADGTPMLLDFNLALGSPAELTPAAGTLPYMAPEYLAGLQSRHACSEPNQDIYALGLILVELLTGQFPFPQRQGIIENVVPAMIADRQQVPARIRSANPAVTPAVVAIVHRCLEPNPARRYRHARELREDIERHLANLPLAHTREPSLAERCRKWRRRHPRLASAGTVAALAVLCLAGLLSWLVMQERSRALLLARTAWQDTRQEVVPLAFLLATSDGPSESITEGLARCASLAERYRLDQDDWMTRPLVQNLPQGERDLLLATLGEVTWLRGRALAWKARSAADYAEVLRILVQARACYPPQEIPPAIARLEARILALAGKQDEAARAASEAQRPTEAMQDHYLGLLDQVEQGKYREALPMLRQVAVGGEKGALGWLLMARAYLELGQLDQAALCGELATNTCPDWPWGWYHLGLVHLTAQEFDRAHQAFTRFLESRPGSPQGRLNRALASLQAHRPEEALKELNLALEMDGCPERAWFLRARVYSELGKEAEARLDLQEGKARQPTDEESWIVRALSWLPAEPDRALADLDQALVLYPESTRALQNRSHVLSEHLGRGPEAIICLDRLLERRPEDLVARAGRCVLLARAGRREKAHGDAARVARDSQTAGLIYQAACAHALTSRDHPEDATEAVRLLRRSFQIEGRWVEIARRDPDLTALQGKPPFEDLLRKAKGWYSGG